MPSFALPVTYPYAETAGYCRIGTVWPKIFLPVGGGWHSIYSPPRRVPRAAACAPVDRSAERERPCVTGWNARRDSDLATGWTGWRVRVTGRRGEAGRGGDQLAAVDPIGLGALRGYGSV
jgi:hypothetical protein